MTFFAKKILVLRYLIVPHLKDLKAFHRSEKSSSIIEKKIIKRVFFELKIVIRTYDWKFPIYNPKYLNNKWWILNSVKSSHILKFGTAIQYLKTRKMKNFEKCQRAPLSIFRRIFIRAADKSSNTLWNMNFLTKANIVISVVHVHL